MKGGNPLGLPDVFVLEPDMPDDDEDESELLEAASGDEEDDCDFVQPEFALVDGVANDEGVGGGGTAYERLGLFVPIVAEGSAADEE
jgi:hypothetical protein